MEGVRRGWESHQTEASLVLSEPDREGRLGGGPRRALQSCQVVFKPKSAVRGVVGFPGPGLPCGSPAGRRPCDISTLTAVNFRGRGWSPGSFSLPTCGKRSEKKILRAPTGAYDNENLGAIGQGSYSGKVTSL